MFSFIQGFGQDATNSYEDPNEVKKVNASSAAAGSGAPVVSPNAAAAEQARIREEAYAARDAFLETLPKPKDMYARLHELQFFALCPNGKRIPVQTICEEYARDPKGIALRSFDDRIVLVIQAMFPGQETPYWQQAFYLSTGTSSGMGGTWLPFDGVLMQMSTSRTVPIGWGENRERIGDEKTLLGTGWFSKGAFCAAHNYMFPSMTTDINELKKQQIPYVYGKLFLPEGDLLYRRSPFDRFGTASYLLASHALGGNEFREGVFSPQSTGNHFFSIGYRFNEDDNVDRLIEILDRPSPLQACFVEMASTYPVSKLYDVNNYIDSHHAMSYMNAFREHGIFPPGLDFAKTPIKSLGYSMPLEYYWDMIVTATRTLFADYKIGTKTLEEIRDIFANPKRELAKIKRASQEACIFPDEPEFSFNLNRSKYVDIPKTLQYYGGRRGRRAKTRKGKARKIQKKRRQTKRH